MSIDRSDANRSIGNIQRIGGVSRVDRDSHPPGEKNPRDGRDGHSGTPPAPPDDPQDIVEVSTPLAPKEISEQPQAGKPAKTKPPNTERHLDIQT